MQGVVHRAALSCCRRSCPSDLPTSRMLVYKYRVYHCRMVRLGCSWRGTFAPMALANSGSHMGLLVGDFRKSIRDSKELRRSLVAELEQGLKYVDGEIEGVVIRALKFFHDQRGWL